MASLNIPSLPIGLTKKDLSTLVKGLEAFYPIETLERQDIAIAKLWQGFTGPQFFEMVSVLTGQNSVKNVHIVLTSWNEQAPEALEAQPKPKALDKTVPDAIHELVEDLEKDTSSQIKQQAVKNTREWIEQVAKQVQPQAETPIEQPIPKPLEAIEKPVEPSPTEIVEPTTTAATFIIPVKTVIPIDDPPEIQSAIKGLADKANKQGKTSFVLEYAKSFAAISKLLPQYEAAELKQTDLDSAAGKLYDQLTSHNKYIETTALASLANPKSNILKATTPNIKEREIVAKAIANELKKSKALITYSLTEDYGESATKIADSLFPSPETIDPKMFKFSSKETPTSLRLNTDTLTQVPTNEADIDTLVSSSPLEEPGLLRTTRAQLSTLPYRIRSSLSAADAAKESVEKGNAREFLSGGWTTYHKEELRHRSKMLGLGVSKKKFDLFIKALEREQSSGSQYVITELTFFRAGQRVNLTNSQLQGMFSDQPAFIGSRPGFFKRIGQQLFGKFLGKAKDKAIEKGKEKLVEKGAEKLVEKGVQVAAKTSISSISTTVGTAIGGPLGAFIGWIVGKVVALAVKIPFWIARKVKENSKEITIGSIVAVIVGLSIGNAFLTAGGIAGGLISFGAGGPGTITGAVSSITGAAGSFFATTMLPTILATTGGVLAGLALLTALIVLIINSGAYITPLPTKTFGDIESPYIDLEKVANPECLDGPGSSCGDLPGDVTYTIRIRAKKSTLTNVHIANEYRVVGEGSSGALPPAPAIDIPVIISPTEPYEFSYTMTYGEDLDNSIVIDTVTVYADVPEQPGIAAATSASVVIGNPPIDCPLPGGHITWGSYTPGDETSRSHGNNRYWKMMGSPYCRYGLPQGLCYGPIDPRASSNECYWKPNSCSFYGYAIDVSGGDDVYAPTVLGESVSWSCSYAFANGGGSSGHTYKCRGGSYTLVLTHMEKSSASSGTFTSGQKIGKLHQNSNKHLHLEFLIDGRGQRPEDFFCSI